MCGGQEEMAFQMSSEKVQLSPHCGSLLYPVI